MPRGDDESMTPGRESLEPVVFRPPGRLTGLRWPALPWSSLGVTFALVAAAAVVIFIFSARAVQFEAVPENAVIAVEGLVSPRLGQRWLMLPGRHRVRAEAAGYYPLIQNVRVGPAAHQRVPLVLKPLPGKLQVRVTPALAAEVLVDGTLAGTAPGVVEDIEAGTREITVRAPRYLDFTVQLPVTGRGETEHVNATLHPAWADFEIASEPPGAQVLSDRAALGVTPLRGELLQGSRQLTVTLQGYKPWSRRIDVTAGQAVRILDVRLQKADGHLAVTSAPPGAAITIDGVFKGETPLRFAASPDRPHEIAALKTGYIPARVTAEVAAGQEHAVRLELVPELAPIEFVTTPTTAELLIDGIPRGSANQTLELPTREHEIIVRQAGFASYRALITPRKGMLKRVQIRLRTAAEMARLSPPPPATPAATTAGSAPAEGPAAGSGRPPQWSAEAQRNADLMMEAMRGAAPAAGIRPVPGRRYTYEGHILGVDCTDWTVAEIRPNGDVLSRCGEYTLETSGEHDQNAVRLTNAQGEPEVEFTPHAEALRLPLAVGKRWSGKYRVSLRELGEALDARAECAVEAEGPVKVPAGEIPAFRIACTDHLRVGTRHVVSRATRWYAPALGIFVKEVHAEDPGRWNFALTGIGDAQGVGPYVAQSAAAGAAAAPVAPTPPPLSFAEEGVVRSVLGQELKLMPAATFGLDQTRIQLTRPYYLALREVSNAEYRRFNGAHVSRGAEGQNLDGDHLPVVNLTWEAAAAYCNWLSRRDSLPVFYQIRYGRVMGVNPEAVGYRLPTDAEWDFAARISPDGKVQEFAWSGGYPPRGRSGNFADESARGLASQVVRGYEDGFAAAAPVGSFPPNLRGLHDLAGNVSEWVHDFDGGSRRGEVRDPLGPPEGTRHVVRGSSWAHATAAELRLDYRAASATPRPDLGFRLARYAQ